MCLRENYKSLSIFSKLLLLRRKELTVRKWHLLLSGWSQPTLCSKITTFFVRHLVHIKTTIRKWHMLLLAGKAGLITSVSGVLGNKPNLKVTVQDIKSTGHKRTIATIYLFFFYYFDRFSYFNHFLGFTYLYSTLPSNNIKSF